MAVRLLFLLFVIILVAFSYISLLNGQHVPFYLSATRQIEVTVSELAILAFSLGAAMVILGTLVKDVTQASLNWKERREKQRKEAARARVAKAADLFQRGDLDEAAKELQRSLSVNPDDREALDLLSRVETERKNPLEAVKALTRMKQIDPSDLSVYFRLASLYRAMNDLTSAHSLLASIEDAGGDNPRAWEGLRDIHLARGEMVQAYAMQKKLIKHKGKAAPPADRALFNGLRYEKALKRLADGKADDAERRLRDLIKEEPPFAAAFVALAESLRGRGNIDEATALLLQGFRATRNAVFLIKLEDLGIETERPQAMIGIYADLLHEFPSDFEVNLFAGKFYLRLEMNDEAVEQFLKAELLDPERESLHILLAEAFRRRGRYESACQHYQRAFGYKRRYLVPFRCAECGTSTIKWTARCPSCGVWNGFAIDHGRREYAVAASVR
ncbi:MAG: tetratricopeptide repeat protein [Deltaproteobacteria bacterium]|nr:tetratricopeptide repeat protein [Deltaproteobacteria bacterium]